MRNTAIGLALGALVIGLANLALLAHIIVKMDDQETLDNGRWEEVFEHTRGPMPWQLR